MDCSKTRNFLKEWERMCSCYPEDCSRCPLACDNCTTYIPTHQEEAIKKVQEWSTANPITTLYDRFRKEHPDAPPGVPKFSPFDLGYIPADLYGEFRDVDAWTLPVTEVEKIISAPKSQGKKVCENKEKTVEPVRKNAGGNPVEDEPAENNSKLLGEMLYSILNNIF